MAKQKNERKTIEIDRRRIPLRQLMHGKEIRDAAKAIEDFRLKLNEKEFLYGAKLYVDWKDYSDVYVVARRLETDQEYADRLERARLAAEAKAERERKRRQQEEESRARRELEKKQRAIEHLKELAKANGITPADLGIVFSPNDPF